MGDSEESNLPPRAERRLCKLAIRLLHTPLPPAPGPDAVYLFQQLDANVESLVTTTVSLHHAHPGMKILVLGVYNEKLGVPIASGYGACPYLLEKLEAAGIDKTCIEECDFDHSGMIHTLVEAQTVVSYAKTRGWKSLAIVAPAFHLVRAVMTAASVAKRDYPELRLHPVSGASLSWQEASMHSQGMVGTRMDFIDSELDRVIKYTQKGDILPWEELEAYFDSCDRALL